MRIKVGATAWAEKTLLSSGWYPKGVRTPEARLRYYASRFPLVENDMAYYAIPEPALTARWAAWTPPGFTMNVKAHALLTGHYTDPRRLPPDLREALPGDVRDKRRVYPRDVGGEIVEAVSERLHAALRPLHEEGRLGLVLFQFPVWFPISRESKQAILRARSRFRPYRVAVEFRNATWMREDNVRETLDFLRGLGVVYTCVDEPQGFPSSVPPIVAATSDVALVRLHGQNAARWARSARSAAERFEYLYSDGALRQWASRVADLAGEAQEVQVVFNNCHRDFAVRNAATMQALLAPLQTEAEAGPPA